MPALVPLLEESKMALGALYVATDLVNTFFCPYQQRIRTFYIDTSRCNIMMSFWSTSFYSAQLSIKWQVPGDLGKIHDAPEGRR